MHHLTRGAHAKEWWLGRAGDRCGGPPWCWELHSWLTSGGPFWLSQTGGLAALIGIWFADDAFVRAGQSVPLS